MNSGIKFYRSDNNVILTSGINGVLPPEFITVHETKRAKK
uniref:Uncharacterized protein n=1 Tax=viral metagenome TaxID=1070528 RepID=A0A6C0BDJ4_9ZZZZ